MDNHKRRPNNHHVGIGNTVTLRTPPPSATTTRKHQVNRQTVMMQRSPLFLLVLLKSLLLMDGRGVAAAWVPTGSFGSPSHSSRALPLRRWRTPRDQVQKTGTILITMSNSILFSKSNDDDDEHQDRNSISTRPVVERLQVSGVSVSPKGFHVLLKKSSMDPPTYLALKVTNDPADAVAASSPESLTLCQLLSGVDMAGAILPPELLSKLVIYHIEEKQQQNDILTPQEEKILDALQEPLSKTSQNSYKDAHVWFQNRIKLPQITLDQLTLIPNTATQKYKKVRWQCRLECALPEWKERLVVPQVRPEILESLVFQYDPESSLLFICLALALRYKAPIVLSTETSMSPQTKDHTAPTDNDTISKTATFTLTPQDLEQEFPQRTTVGKLQQQSTRVTANIERGFEIHKLQGALTIAMKMGDTEAAKRIRAKLDEYDSMQDLPTTTTATRIAIAMNDNDDDTGTDGDCGGLDDLDKNILQ